MEHLKFEVGFRFRPTDSEGLTYLLRFVAGQEMYDSGFITTNVDVYGKQEPWEIYDSGVPCGDDEGNSSYRYFITKLKKKTDERYHRSVGNKGTWKQEAKNKPVHYKNMGNTSSLVNIGSRTCFSYKNKKFYPEDQKDGHWLMKEYELSEVILHKFDEDRRDYVLCAIKKLKHVNSSSETSPVTTLNNVSEGTDHEVASSVDDLLATNNCKGYYNMCKNLEHSETLAFQESMVMNNSVFEPLQVAAEPAEVPDYLYQWGEVRSSVDDLLATNKCKDYNMCKNLEHSETMAFQESMVMNDTVDEAAERTNFEMPELEVPDDLYQWDGKELDEQNQILDDVPKVDVAMNIAEPLAATVEPTDATNPVEAIAMLHVDQLVSDNSVHVQYSEVATFDKEQGQQGCAANHEDQLYWLSTMELEDTGYEMLEPNEAFQLAP